VMYEPFERRRKRLESRAGQPAFTPLEQLLQIPIPESSEDRLQNLPKDSWRPAFFAEATREFLREAGFTAVVRHPGEALPPLGPDVTYKYRCSYHEVPKRIARGENVLVAVVIEDDRVIGYGIATQGNAGSEIEIIDVDKFSRRSAGLEHILALDGRKFGVGVGHVVVDLLADALSKPVFVDASSPESRYIFKSLGFTRRPEERNPCLLQLLDGT